MRAALEDLRFRKKWFPFSVVATGDFLLLKEKSLPEIDLAVPIILNPVKICAVEIGKLWNEYTMGMKAKATSDTLEIFGCEMIRHSGMYGCKGILI